MRIQPKNILWATDLSEYSNGALPYAAALARKFSARLVAAHAIDLSAVSSYDPAVFLVPEARANLRKFAEEKLQKMLAMEKVDGSVAVVEGEPSSQLAEVVDQQHIDLIVAATHARAGLKRLLLGSVTERLLHHVTCPFLVIRTPEHEFVDRSDGSLKLRKILVGCDFSEDSGRAIEHAIGLAEEFEAELHLLHVVEPSVYRGLSKAASALAKDLEKAVEVTLREKLAALVSREDHPWCETQTAISNGSPHEEIYRYALAQGMDLVVVGARGHTLLDSFKVGSTSDRIARHAPCPVLVVRKTPA